MQVDPIRTYPRRGAVLVARSVQLERFRVEIAGRSAPLQSDPPCSLGAEQQVELPIRRGRETLGTITLDLGERKLGTDELRVARWAARLYARGLSLRSRLSTEAVRRSPNEGVDDALARTSLTKRECEVVRLLAGGSTTREIAKETGLTVSTINTYMKRIFAKLGVHSRVELVARLAGTAA